MAKALALAGVLLLVACQTTGGTFCAVSRPIRPTAAEIQTMSDETVAAILSQNLKGQKLCGWKP